MKTLLAACLLTVASVGFAESTEDEAGDVSEIDKDSVGPLRDRVRAVTGHVLLMDGRFELTPHGALSMKDAFFSKYGLGLTATYHFAETMAVSLRGDYFWSVVSGAAQLCETGQDGAARGCRSPTLAELTANRSFGQLGLVAGADFEWTPVYGKLSLFAEQFLSVNMYAIAGARVLQYGATQTWAPGGNVGAGIRVLLNRWMGIRLEVKDLIYFEKGTTSDSLRNQLFFEVGYSMFLPTTFAERAQ